MDKRKAMEELFRAMVETGADFSYNDGDIVVGGTTFTCREDYIVVETEHATSFYQYATLSYICSRGDSVQIADTHAGVFGSYRVR